MDLQRIKASAEAKCDYLKDDHCDRVYISALADSPVAAGVLESFIREADKSDRNVRVIRTGSGGYYDIEPLVTVDKPGRGRILYKNVTPGIAEEIFKDCIVNDNPGPGLAYCSSGNFSVDGIPDITEIPLFGLQKRIALRNCGIIDPGEIDHYILLANGYSGLSAVLGMDPPDVIGEIEKSGLRSRGVDCLPVYDKWKSYQDAEANEKYVICNAVDADPKAMTARLLLESDPHSVLEGILIGVYTIGASHCIIVVDSGQVEAVKILRQAIAQMNEYGLLGDNILDSDFRCDIEIKEAAPALVMSEETALLCVLEDRQAMPYMQVGRPAVSYFLDSPALVENVESFADVSTIFRDGTESVSGTGTEKSKGSLVTTLCGDIAQKFTVEVPFGTTLGTLVNDIAGGVKNGGIIKAVQFGGPPGMLFQGDSLDTPVSYEAMEKIGAAIGSGTVEVFDNSRCAVEITGDIMAYLQAQSCGKCVFCREGTYQMLEILEDISRNKGKREDLELLAELGNAMKAGSICSVGKTAPNPVLSGIRLFAKDYDAHIDRGTCPAGRE